jgi:ankyrin repeat protein
MIAQESDETMLDRIVDDRTDLVFDYLEEGNAATSADGDGVSLMSWCARSGDVSAMRLLLSRGANLQSLGNNLGLSSAAFHGHWQLCQFLIEHGADARAADPRTGETALHAATSKANRPAYTLVVTVLLAGGADPNASAAADAETDAFMRDARTRGETPLHRAAAFGTEECIQLLLDAGGRREAKDAHGDSPLSWASWHLRPDSILRRLGYARFSLQPSRRSVADHGAGGAPSSWTCSERPMSRRRRRTEEATVRLQGPKTC